jgi:peptide-methionine (S)-S-oxide reductase
VKTQRTKESNLVKATFGAGCFWGVEAAFRQLPGVVATRVGYTGGNVPNPTYELVCSHGTGHAEAVEVTFDPTRVSYEDLLNVFWTSHNPTTRDRQGLDIGSQYRSAIFFHSPDQQAAAERTKEEQQAKLRWPKKIVTEIAPAPEFYEAEDYHQQYLEKRGRSTCTVELAQTAS